MSTRVLFVDQSAAPSGAQLFLTRMLEHVAEIDPVVVLLADGPLRARLEAAGAEVRLCPLPSAVAEVSAEGGAGGGVAGVSGLMALPRFLRALAHEVRDARPDVVYGNSAKANVLAVPLARLLRRPVVAHVHDQLTPENFSTPNLLALRAVTRAASWVVANSRDTQRSLDAGPRRRSEVLYCPTDTSTPPAPVRPEPRPLSVAVVGRFAEWKGQALAVEALDRVVTARGREAVDLHLYGDAAFGKDLAYRDDVRRSVGERGLADLVHLHGHVDDVTAAMRRHDVVAHTSTKPEPMGQVLLEAMAAGVPLVAADSGGPVELVEPGVTGLLYRTGDAGALAAAWERLLDEPGLRARLAEAAYTSVQQWSYASVVPGWERRLASLAR